MGLQPGSSPRAASARNQPGLPPLAVNALFKQIHNFEKRKKNQRNTANNEIPKYLPDQLQLNQS